MTVSLVILVSQFSYQRCKVSTTKFGRRCCVHNHCTIPLKRQPIREQVGTLPGWTMQHTDLMRPDEDWVKSSDEPLALDIPVLTRYERQLADASERRKIQNRIAQRAYRMSALVTCILGPTERFILHGSLTVTNIPTIITRRLTLPTSIYSLEDMLMLSVIMHRTEHARPIEQDRATHETAQSVRGAKPRASHRTERREHIHISAATASEQQ